MKSLQWYEPIFLIWFLKKIYYRKPILPSLRPWLIRNAMNMNDMIGVRTNTSVKTQLAKRGDHLLLSRRNREHYAMSWSPWTRLPVLARQKCILEHINLKSAKSIEMLKNSKCITFEFLVPSVHFDEYTITRRIPDTQNHRPIYCISVGSSLMVNAPPDTTNSKSTGIVNVF